MSASSQDQSFQLFSCKWAWCRSTFSDNAGLVHHVVHDHVRRAIPVRRRDISMIRRAEEGRGESLKISELMVDMYSYSSRELVSHKSDLPVELPQEPSSSLPSPPASSPALHSPQNLSHSPGPAPSPSPLSSEHRKKYISIGPRSSDDISRHTSPPLLSSKPLQGHISPCNQFTAFSSLSSPEPERPPFSFEIPDSPSFSSLVKRPNKRKITIADNMSRKNGTAANQPQPVSPSHTSLDSQNSVEAHLTQTEYDNDDDIHQDLNLDLRHHSSSELFSQAQDIPSPSCGLIHEHSDHREELQWELSQPAEGYLASKLTLQSQSKDHHNSENLPFMSQPPSQLRLESEFPFHFHDHPRGSTSGAVLDPSAAMPLSPLSPAPAFAVSTPVRQNWYQPPLKRRKRSTCKDTNSEPSPLKAEASVSQTKSKKTFRSGTSQIIPASSPEEAKVKHTIIDVPMDIDSNADCQNNLTSPDSPYDLEIFSQSSQDSSSFFAISSYPALQTQAPYQSQSLTQF